VNKTEEMEDYQEGMKWLDLVKIKLRKLVIFLEDHSPNLLINYFPNDFNLNQNDGNEVFQRSIFFGLDTHSDDNAFIDDSYLYS
jgi:hypothetical protein